MSVTEQLRSLHGVPGVYGSFLVDRWGGIVAREVSAVICPHDLQCAAASLWRLWYGLDVSIAHDLVLEFAHHRLLSCRLRGGSLCVLVGSTVSLDPVRAACGHLDLASHDAAFAPAVGQPGDEATQPVLTAG